MRSTIAASPVAERPTPTLPEGHVPVSLRAPGISRAQACPIQKPVTLIGSRRDCDFPLTHPDVSKVHCVVVHTGRAVFVCDLRSRCGTFVNEQFAQLSELQPGTKLRVGSVNVEVNFAASDSLEQAWSAALAAPTLRLHGVTEHALKAPAAVIGRRNTCDVTVDAPDVSLAHALLLFLDGRPALCDLGSRSGTHLNGEQISLCWLCDGDEIRIGSQKWRVEWHGPIGFTPADPARPELVELERAIEAKLQGESGFAPEPVTAGDWERAFARSAAAPVLEKLADYELGDIGRTVQQMIGQLSRVRSAVERRAAELAAQHKELERREADLRQREQLLAAREAGERMASEKIEQFKVALNLAQQLFHSPEPGTTSHLTGTNGKVTNGVARQPLFEKVTSALNGHAVPAPTLAARRLQAIGGEPGNGALYH